MLVKYNVINCTEEDLEVLYKGSALTFEGTTTDEENLDWLVNWLDKHGTTMETKDFYVVSGKLMNSHYGLRGTVAYPDDLNILCIKLKDLTPYTNIVVPRFEIGGRWFDDVVDNNRRNLESIDREAE